MKHQVKNIVSGLLLVTSFVTTHSSNWALAGERGGGSDGGQEAVLQNDGTLKLFAEAYKGELASALKANPPKKYPTYYAIPEDVKAEVRRILAMAVWVPMKVELDDPTIYVDADSVDSAHAHRLQAAYDKVADRLKVKAPAYARIFPAYSDSRKTYITKEFYTNAPSGKPYLTLQQKALVLIHEQSMRHDSVDLAKVLLLDSQIREMVDTVDSGREFNFARMISLAFDAYFYPRTRARSREAEYRLLQIQKLRIARGDKPIQLSDLGFDRLSYLQGIETMSRGLIELDPSMSKNLWNDDPYIAQSIDGMYVTYNHIRNVEKITERFGVSQQICRENPRAMPFFWFEDKSSQSLDKNAEPETPWLIDCRVDKAVEVIILPTRD
jgi:hypothetical protein